MVVTGTVTFSKLALLEFSWSSSLSSHSNASVGRNDVVPQSAFKAAALSMRGSGWSGSRSMYLKSQEIPWVFNKPKIANNSHGRSQECNPTYSRHRKQQQHTSAYHSSGQLALRHELSKATVFSFFHVFFWLFRHFTMTVEGLLTRFYSLRVFFFSIFNIFVLNYSYTFKVNQ